TRLDRSGAVPKRPSIKARRCSRVCSGADILFIGMLLGANGVNRRPTLLLRLRQGASQPLFPASLRLHPAIDQARVEIPKGPTLILGTQETRVRNPDERCLFRAPRVLIIIGIVSTARSLTSLGELNSLHGRRSQNLGRLQDARPRFSCQGPRKFSGDIAGESLRR